MILSLIPIIIIALAFFFDLAASEGGGTAKIISAFRGVFERESKYVTTVKLLEDLDSLRNEKEKYTRKEVLTFEESSEYQCLLEKIEDREKIIDKIISNF